MDLKKNQHTYRTVERRGESIIFENHARQKILNSDQEIIKSDQEITISDQEIIESRDYGSYEAPSCSSLPHWPYQFQYHMYKV
jgi:hypothetical protein